MRRLGSKRNSCDEAFFDLAEQPRCRNPGHAGAGFRRQVNPMKLSYFIVIVDPGDDPMGISARDAAEVRAQFGDVALCAPTTKAALLRAGWDEATILMAGEPLIQEVA